MGGIELNKLLKARHIVPIFTKDWKLFSVINCLGCAFILTSKKDKHKSRIIRTWETAAVFYYTYQTLCLIHS